MNTINRYIDNQRAYFAKKKSLPLIGFTNAQGEPASWNDIAVTFTYDDSRFINFIFCNLKKKLPNKGTPFSDDDKLTPDIHDMLFSYALDVIKENVSIPYNKKKITIAKKFLLLLEENIALATHEKIQKTINLIADKVALNHFLTWLYHHEMLAKSSKFILEQNYNSSRTKTGDEALEAEKNKLPSENALLALGAIFYDVIPPYIDDMKENLGIWQPLLSPIKSQKDSFVCTMAALGMSSPNRVGSEQVILTQQRIQKHSQIVDGQPKTVHFLNWRGSKGHKDYQNHINAEMVESLDRALHYTIIATEPARALARFYRKPNRPLKEVLGVFKPSNKNTELLTPSMNQPTNLLHLGLLLGLFDDGDKCVRVTADTPGAIDLSNNQFQKFIKPIAQIELSDTLMFMQRCVYSNKLTGSPLIIQSQLNKYTSGKDKLTLAEFQNHTITLNESQLTGFNKNQTKSVDFDNALFAYTYKQLGEKNKSPFLLVPIKSLSGFFSDDLNKHKKIRPTIFERHGFSSAFSLKPHQLRHWQNDYLAKKGLPHHLITMLSGRKSAEQTLTYIHTTDAQNASVVGDISYSNELESNIEEKISLRIRTMNQYNEAVNNETPTFIHETGFCTQNLTISPCTYMSDFETQCALCSSSCHVTHDSKAIDLLHKDLKVQTHRLEEVQKAHNFETSEGMQKWYKTHYNNSCMLKNLIGVLSDDAIKPGCSVRLLTRSNRIRITNLETKTVEEETLALPNTEQALQAALEARNVKSSDEATNNFLGFLGSL
ncbi:MAG: hypothetical protein ACTH58_14885 [Marinomonas foliarum]|uniref:hypothetical protein n=1 Tax=Marinomonas foliarum TaxID=491950 RepID=UPI003F9C6857